MRTYDQAVAKWAKRKWTELCRCVFRFLGQRSATVKNVRQKPWNSNYFSILSVVLLSRGISFFFVIFVQFVCFVFNKKFIRICTTISGVCLFKQAAKLKQIKRNRISISTAHVKCLLMSCHYFIRICSTFSLRATNLFGNFVRFIHLQMV